MMAIKGFKPGLLDKLLDKVPLSKRKKKVVKK